ncbi:MAG: lipopolysaccharide assembly protein LapA domain-containing protein [Gammaproteobacteria bacterium]|nr:lipopolysaccharide assembly protein LapA domain-containing protein [Gammaproteobacteria bacterium]
MGTFTRLLAGVFAIGVFVAAVVFAFYNDTPVAIGLGAWRSPPQAVSIWILGAFLGGGLLGLLLGLRLFQGLRRSSREKKLIRQLATARGEIERLRAAG